MDAEAYRIVGWAERYEVTDQGRAAKPGESCRVNPLPYVRLKVNGFSQGPGYRSLQVVAGSCRKLEGAFAVFCKLLELSASQTREKRGWILNHQGQPATVDNLAFYTGFAKSTITRALVILTDPKVGWLEVATCTNLQEPVSTYRSLQIPSELNSTELNSTELKKDLSANNADDTPRKPESSKYSKGFQAFWEAYPHDRRYAKGRCFKRWQQDKLEKQAGEIIAKVKAFEGTLQWQQHEFIPLSLTWLNQQRWDTDLADITDIPEADTQEADRKAQAGRVRLLRQKEKEDARNRR